MKDGGITRTILGLTAILTGQWSLHACTYGVLHRLRAKKNKNKIKSRLCRESVHFFF
jgi:hypothetical protein